MRWSCSRPSPAWRGHDEPCPASVARPGRRLRPGAGAGRAHPCPGAPALFAVPIDGGAIPRALSSLLPSTRSVESDVVPLGAGRALFRADIGAGDVFELFEGFAARARPLTR